MPRSDHDDMLDRAMHDTFDPEPRPTEPRLYARGTPVRNLRLDDTRWTAVQNEATRTGSTASDVIRAALDGYLDRRP